MTELDSGGRFIYLGRPVDLVKHLRSGMDGGGTEKYRAASTIESWESHAKSWAEEYGIGLYLPAQAFHAAGVEVGPEIRRINDYALDQCDGMLALYHSELPSFGLPTEIESSRVAGRPVAVVCDRGSREKLWSLRVPGVRMFDYVDEAMDYLHTEIKAGRGQEARDRGMQGVRRLPVLLGAGGAQLPRRTYPDDAGMDLVCSRDVDVQPGSFTDIPCDIAIELPSSHWGLITGRSSTIRKKGLLVAQGVIDPGYRGLLFAGVWNLTTGQVQVKAGERVAQLILFPNETAGFQPVEVEELGVSERGHNGFGSTGT